jgi:twinkle protein
MKTWADFRIELPHGAAGEVDVTCPECSASRKKKHARCLGVNVEKGVWDCKHCGWRGTLKEGARKGEYDHWQKPVYTRPEPKPVADDLDVAMLQWFAMRSIPAKVLRRNKISLQTVYMPQVEDRVKAICFPFYRGEEFINAKYRDREKNFRMEAGAERILYGLNDIDPKRCVIVEGEIDKLSVEVAGITSCVSVPDGAPAINAKNYDSKFTFLDCEQVAEVREWIIAVDSDEPGTRLQQELARRFGLEKCKRVKWPEGCKDANEVLTKHGADKLRECLDRAEEFPLEGVIYINDLEREIDLLYAEGETRGVSTGWPGFDRYFTVRPGELTVITGIPGHGKSNWLDSLLVNLARQHNWVTGIFSPENAPLHRHASRLMEKFIREPFRPGPTKRMSPERKTEAREWCSFFFPLILPEEESDWTVDSILDIGKKLVRRHGMRAMVIDPWNELEDVRPAAMTETEYTGKCLKRMRQFARHHDVHLFLVVHPTKLYRGKDGQYPVPTLYDCSGSAHFRNKPDNGIVVWRDLNDTSKPVDVHVQKIRDRVIGEVGGMPFRYNKVLADYEEMSGPVRDSWSQPE